MYGSMNESLDKDGIWYWYNNLYIKFKKQNASELHFVIVPELAPERQASGQDASSQHYHPRTATGPVVLDNALIDPQCQMVTLP